MDGEKIHFYYDKEYWSPPTNSYPTWDDVCRFISSRTSNSPRLTVTEATQQMATFVGDIWLAGDGCPLSKAAIYKLYMEKIRPIEVRYRKGDSDNSKRSHHKKKNTDEKEAPQPKRKSARLKSPVPQQQPPQQQLQSPEQLRSPEHLQSPEQLQLPEQLQSPEQLQLPEQLKLPQCLQQQNPVQMSTPTKEKVGSSSKKKSSTSRKSSNPDNQRYEKWMNDYGKLLFDVFSVKEMIEAREEGHTFDSEFYEDQKNIESRKLIIHRMRVRKEWVEQEKALERTKALKYARMLSQKGLLSEEEKKRIDKFTDDPEECPVENSPFKIPLASKSISSSQFRSTIETRKQCVSNAKKKIHFALMDVACQTTQEYHPRISTRASEQSTICNRKYLHAGALMMAVNNQSAGQTVMNMYFMDTEVHDQSRTLPLALQKKYQKILKAAKKLRAVTCRSKKQENDLQIQNTPENGKEKETSKEVSLECDEEITEVNLEENFEETNSEEEITEVNPEENSEEGNSDEENDEAVFLTAEIDLTEKEPDQSSLESAEEYIRNMKEYNKKHLNEVLPDPRTIREAHRVASCYLEGKVAEEMVGSGTAYLMPDGTSRAKVGRMGASLVHVGDKMRALKLQKMGNDTQDNWAETIIHQLKRLSTASDIPIEEIYETIKAIISDACSVNKGLAKTLSAKLGVRWVPGQLYCCIHTVLGFQSGMVKLWMKYQKSVGYEKMYPEITGMELEMEGKCLIKQILECFLRLTADRWQARAWNKYEEFVQFCVDHDFINLAQQLHGNRFGELEKCCGIGIYLLDVWNDFIDTYSNIRNQLAIFLRDTSHLKEICNFLWLGPALIGIHLTEPYLLLLLEKKITHLDLLIILPQLYKELTEYPCSLAQITAPAFPSLADGWIDPLSKEAPYHPEVGKGIVKAIAQCDSNVLNNYCKEMCKAMGKVLKTQRGDAYGFGTLDNSSELVTKQLTEDELKTALTHTKDVENLFGVEDAILTRFGGQAFEKSTDDLVIRYSKDLLPPPSDWCTSKMRKKKRELDVIQSTFNEKQNALLKAGVSKTDVDILQEENKIQKVVEQCRKSHEGPIFTEKELDDRIVDKFKKDEQSLRNALIYEIRYRKFTVNNIKEDNPLFKQRNLSVEELVANLKLLLTKTDRTMASTVTMEDLEGVIGVEQADCPSKKSSGNKENNESKSKKVKKGSKKSNTDSSKRSNKKQKPDNEISNTTTSSTKTNNDDKESINTSGSEAEEYSRWPPEIGEHIAVNFDDGFHIGEVLEIIDDETVGVSYMKPKKVLTANANEHPRKFWIWPYPEVTHRTNRQCILDLRPADLMLAIPPSTKRMLVFSVGNAELLHRLWSQADITI